MICRQGFANYLRRCSCCAARLGAFLLLGLFLRKAAPASCPLGDTQLDDLQAGGCQLLENMFPGLVEVPSSPGPFFGDPDSDENINKAILSLPLVNPLECSAAQAKRRRGNGVRVSLKSQFDAARTAAWG